MNDHDFHFRIRQQLNVSARNVSPEIATKLHAARQRALSKQRVRVAGLSLAGMGAHLSTNLLSRGKTVLAMVLVIVAALGTGFLGELRRVADMEEVDSALLADDLPIDAYLDRGFDAWIQDDSAN